MKDGSTSPALTSNAGQNATLVEEDRYGIRLGAKELPLSLHYRALAASLHQVLAAFR